jgi:hypothetical protein
VFGGPEGTISEPSLASYGVGLGSPSWPGANAAGRSGCSRRTSWCCCVAVFWYPTTFTLRQQTTFGWFENDVYTGLLMIALYLGAHRLRGVTRTAGR